MRYNLALLDTFPARLRHSIVVICTPAAQRLLPECCGRIDVIITTEPIPLRHNLFRAPTTGAAVASVEALGRPIFIVEPALHFELQQLGRMRIEHRVAGAGPIIRDEPVELDSIYLPLLSPAMPCAQLLATAVYSAPIDTASDYRWAEETPMQCWFCSLAN